MLAFDVGDRGTAERLLDALTIPPRTASLGSIRTIAVHPALDDAPPARCAGLELAGISQGLIRVSVGLEDVDDLIADFDQALTTAATCDGDPRRLTRHRPTPLTGNPLTDRN